MSTATALKTDRTDAAETDRRAPKDVREEAGLSLPQMAELMGMSLRGYQSWEDGLRRPGGPARRLLRLIDNDAETVKRVIGDPDGQN